MSKVDKFWDTHDPFLIFCSVVTLIIIVAAVAGFVIWVHNGETAWHDLGKVHSVGSTYNYDDNNQRWETIYNATIYTQNHGTIVVFSYPTSSCFGCPYIDWTMKVNNTVGVIQTYGGNYGVRVLA